jgi:signal transduction histidine kinase
MTGSAVAPSPSPPKILLVDDEPQILVALEDLLDSHYDILAAASPAEALALLERNGDVAVIVSDQRMPEMTGAAFLARARGVTDAEAILLTGYADLSAVVSAVNQGAISGYMSKPWEPEALQAMVGAAAERYCLRKALAFEQAAFSALAERSADAVSILDAQGRLVRTNVRATELRAEGVDADLDADIAALRQGAFGEEERKLEAANGGSRWIRTRRIPFGEAAATTHLLRIESDETEHRLAQQKMHQSEKLQALGSLAGGIAHDFNNLLAVILGNLELAGRARDNAEKLTRYLTNAAEAAKRGTGVSRRLLAFSRQRDLAAETFNPATAVKEIEELVVRSMASRVMLRIEASDDTWPVHTDPNQFELAVINMCINARDAMPDGGEVVISARNAGPSELPALLDPGDFVRVSVSDNGCGMSEEVRARVFEPFFTTKPQGQGTGLGLPMVRAMAEAAGGTVTIDSIVDQGTSVCLWLPRANASSALPRLAGTWNKVDRELRILIAEDDPDVREMLHDHLHAGGHSILAVSDADSALRALAEESPFDLLISDVAMPKRSGLELSSLVAERWPDLPMLMVTGFAELEGDLPKLMVLTKPFSGAQLHDAIHRCLETHPK